MSLFSRMDRLTSRAVDQVNAIRFEVHPGKATPNGRSGPDPDRPRWDGRGVLEETPNFPPVELGKRDRSGNDLHSVVSGVVIELSVDVHRWPQARQARQGDRIRTDDMRRFEISSTRPDGLARVVFSLTEMKG